MEELKMLLRNYIILREEKKDIYYKTYCEDRKIYMLSGAATGVFISIILI